MLSGIRIENFKSFKDTSIIRFPPLTCLAGVNSAGKSSIIQALLLIKQTLESPPGVALNPEESIYLDKSLGDKFNDFIFERPPLEDASLTYHISFTFDETTIADYTIRDLFDEIDALLPYSPSISASRSLKVNLAVTFTWGPFGKKRQNTVRIADFKTYCNLISDNNQDPLVSIQIRPASNGEYQLESILDQTETRLKDLDFNQVRLDGFVNFLPNSFVIDSSHQTLVEKNVPQAFVRFFRALFSLIRQDLSENILYLGSFRQPPKLVYPGGMSANYTLNPTGSNFAEIFWRYRNEPIEFYHPNLPKEEFTLKTLTSWVLEEILQMKQHISIQPIGDREDILEVLVDTLGPKDGKNKKTLVPISEVGLGYNQVLPIVIQGLLTPPGAMVIYEQPEIHLHPDIQANLIPFFIGLIRSGRLVLIETHSSFLIDNLCLEIVKDKEYGLDKKANVLFIHPPDTENNGSRIELIEIDPYGVILNYPPHFIPDYAGLLEKITKEGFKKRRESSKMR